MLCVDEGLLEKKKKEKKKAWEDSILGWPLHFPIHRESLWGKMSREKKGEKQCSSGQKHKTLGQQKNEVRRLWSDVAAGFLLSELLSQCEARDRKWLREIRQ